MPYPDQIITMGQNLLNGLEGASDLHEHWFLMLWGAVLYHHFPLDFNYGIVPVPKNVIAGNGPKPKFLVMKVAFGSEHVVVVAMLKKSTNETSDARVNVVQELVDCIQTHFTGVGYPAIYGIAGIGLSWTAIKIGRAGPHQTTTLVSWRSDIVSEESFLSLKAVADEINVMTA